MKNPSYNYKKHMSNAAIREIFDHHWKKVPLLKKGGKVKLSELGLELMDFHVKNGGLKTTPSKALSKVLKWYSIENPNKLIPTSERGYWQMNLGEKRLRRKAIKSARPPRKKKLFYPVHPEFKYGKGNFFIYAFFDGNEIFKVGKTTNPQSRYDSLKTSFVNPWKYKIQIQLPTEQEMKEYEKAIHSLLTLNGFHIDNRHKGGGKEMFRISPTKLKNIITKLNVIVGIKWVK
jgi:hypothetical protein